MLSFLCKQYRNFLENKVENLLDLLFLIGILIFAFLITYRSGGRGFFAFDQSIVFDGSYRIVSGQIPYKDFLIPFGPMTFWLQAIFFKIFGISYFVYICGAAVINVVVAAESFFLVRILFPKPKMLSYFAGILTSVWFYPPFGTPWPEQTAFFFSLTALLMTVRGLLSKRIPATWKQTLFFGAGLLVFGAFISKQNAGAFILPICASLFFLLNQGEVRHAIRDLAVFCLGYLVALLLFGAWLIVQSDLALFWKHFVEIPATEVGNERLPSSLGQWLWALLVEPQNETVLSITILFPIVALVSILFEKIFISWKDVIEPRRLIAALLVFLLYLGQNLFLITSNNQTENAVPFLGLIAALSLGIAWTHEKVVNKKWANFQRDITITFCIGLVVISVSMAWYGLHVAFSRQIHGIFEKSTFPNRLSTGKLSAIKWGQPTRIGNLITAEHIDQLVAYLEMEDENFFVFPDFTILYGTVGVPSPQPVLWFHGGLTYPRPNDPSLDAWVVSDLIRYRVTIIVLEEESWFHTDERLADFPQLQAFIQNRFDVENRIGNFIIYKKLPIFKH